jgi:bifunctional DNA-binding transcriptional regulator/antitoxin component of YhaV-PrlF toxin-antitoxin module
MTKSWTITTEEDPDTGEIILPLPTELLELQGWGEGDTLEWIENDDGSWIIKKVI